MTGDVSGRRSSLLSLRGMDLLTPTEMELREAIRDYDSSLNAAVWRLMENADARAVITTLADSGLIMFSRLADADGAGWRTRVAGEHIPCLEDRPIDTLGCGDALLASASLALAAGSTLAQASFIGAVAAAVEAAVLGNVTVTKSNLQSRLHEVAGWHVTVRTNIAPKSTPMKA